MLKPKPGDYIYLWTWDSEWTYALVHKVKKTGLTYSTGCPNDAALTWSTRYADLRFRNWHNSTEFTPPPIERYQDMCTQRQKTKTTVSDALNDLTVPRVLHQIIV